MQTVRIHIYSLLFIILAICCGVPGNPAYAQDTFPKLTGRVMDYAELITPATKMKLIDMLAAFEAKSSDQVVVATITSLEGRPLEEYANLLFRHWKLGQVDENNGVLLLIAKNDRKVRIEVGYGLEGELTDVLSKLIIENIIVPNFRANQFSDGIYEGAEQIIGVLSGNAAELKARARRTNQPTKFSSDDESVPWPVYLFIAAFLALGLFPILASIFGKKLGAGRYKWLGVIVDVRGSGNNRRGSGGGWSGGSSGGGFSGGGGSSGGGGASGSW